MLTETEIERRLVEVPRWPLYVQVFTSVIVFLLSGTYHTLSCQSHKTFVIFRKLDFTGIVIALIGGSTAPFYYGFFCEEMHFWRDLWLGMVYVSCLFALVVILSPQLISGSKNNYLVAGTLIVAGYSSSPGFLHMWLFIDSKYLPVVPVWTFVIAGLLAACGGIIYTLKVPERWGKGRFDFIGNSHNIFHCMVIAASLMAIKGSIRMFHERQLYQCPI